MVVYSTIDPKKDLDKTTEVQYIGVVWESNNRVRTVVFPLFPGDPKEIYDRGSPLGITTTLEKILEGIGFKRGHINKIKYDLLRNISGKVTKYLEERARELLGVYEVVSTLIIPVSMETMLYMLSKRPIDISSGKTILPGTSLSKIYLGSIVAAPIIFGSVFAAMLFRILYKKKSEIKKMDFFFIPVIPLADESNRVYESIGEIKGEFEEWLSKTRVPIRVIEKKKEEKMADIYFRTLFYMSHRKIRDKLMVPLVIFSKKDLSNIEDHKIMEYGRRFADIVITSGMKNGRISDAEGVARTIVGYMESKDIDFLGILLYGPYKGGKSVRAFQYSAAIDRITGGTGKITLITKK